MSENLKVDTKTNILEFKRKHNKLVDFLGTLSTLEQVQEYANEAKVKVHDLPSGFDGNISFEDLKRYNAKIGDILIYEQSYGIITCLNGYQDGDYLEFILFDIEGKIKYRSYVAVEEDELFEIDDGWIFAETNKKFYKITFEVNDENASGQENISYISGVQILTRENVSGAIALQALLKNGDYIIMPKACDGETSVEQSSYKLFGTYGNQLMFIDVYNSAGALRLLNINNVSIIINSKTEF